MGKKKLYITPEVEVFASEPIRLLEASFSNELQNDDPLTDPENVL